MSREKDWERRRFLGWLAVAAGVTGWSGIARAAGTISARTERVWRAMGTLCAVSVPDLPEPEAIAAIGRVRRRMETLEAAMTLYRPGSPLVAFNRSTPGTWLRVPEALAAAAAAAVEAGPATGGRFDPTVGPAIRALGLFDLSGTGTFDRKALDRWRTRPGAEAVSVDLRNRRLRRADPRVELDLGGIGKGIAVDAALEELQKAGSRAALVNLGGSIGVLGAPPGEPEGWPIGLAHPRRPGAVVHRFRLAAGHVATSGDSERRRETSEGVVHHLLDPRSGEPVLGPVSVTVWRPTGIGADIASTERFLGVAAGIASPDSAVVMRMRGTAVEIETTGDRDLLSAHDS